MQNQVNLNQVSMNVETSSVPSQPQYIIQGIPSIQGGVVNLADLLNKASAGTHKHTHLLSLWRFVHNFASFICHFRPSGESEEAVAASALEPNIQHATVVNEGGQRVITIVTDQHGNLQTTGGMTQPFFVTMQHGQQSTTRTPSNLGGPPD